MIIEDSINGMLIPTRNAYLMYKAMKKIILENSFAQNLSYNAVSIRNLLDTSVIANKWISIIEE